MKTPHSSPSEPSYGVPVVSSLDKMTPLCVNSLWPSDAIWWCRTGSPLAHVMACCLTAPSHYMSQCWLIISEVQWHLFIWGQFHKIYLSDQSLRQIWKISKISFKYPRDQWVNMTHGIVIKLKHWILSIHPAHLGWRQYILVIMKVKKKGGWASIAT